jgi:uncharacterized membrane protein YfcA
MLSEAIDLWYLLLPLALLGGLAAGSTGFGIYLVFGPILWFVFSPTAALATGLATGLPALVLLYHLRDALHLEKVKTIALFAIPGTLLGISLHLFLDPGLLRLLAAFVVIVLVYMSVRVKLRLRSELAGMGAGALGSSVGFNGPPVYFAFQDEEERSQRANTILSLFLVSLIIALTFLAAGFLQSKISIQDFLDGYLLGVLLIPLVSLGLVIGNRLANRLGEKIKLIAIAVSLFGAGLLVIRSLGIS